LTGEVPFRGDTPVATVMKHLTEVPTIRGHPSIPESIVPILEKCLAKDRAHRFKSAEALGVALQATLADSVGTESTFPVMRVNGSAVMLPEGEPDEAPATHSSPTPVPTSVPTPIPTSPPTTPMATRPTDDAHRRRGPEVSADGPGLGQQIADAPRNDGAADTHAQETHAGRDDPLGADEPFEPVAVQPGTAETPALTPSGFQPRGGPGPRRPGVPGNERPDEIVGQKPTTATTAHPRSPRGGAEGRSVARQALPYAAVGLVAVFLVLTGYVALNHDNHNASATSIVPISNPQSPPVEPSSIASLEPTLERPPAHGISQRQQPESARPAASRSPAAKRAAALGMDSPNALTTNRPVVEGNDRPTTIVTAVPSPEVTHVSTPPPQPLLPPAASQPGGTGPNIAIRTDSPISRPSLTLAPVPSVSASAMPAPAVLVFKIRPWATISVDGGAPDKTTRLTVSPGRHALVFTHPDYQPLRRAVDMASGETRLITIDMRDEAVRKR
jgi:hypothetical protein